MVYLFLLSLPSFSLCIYVYLYFIIIEPTYGLDSQSSYNIIKFIRKLDPSILID